LPEIISNTSPLQYLFQLGMLHVLPALAVQVIIPPAVADELRVGRESGIHLPNPADLNWLVLRPPVRAFASRLVTDLGPGETEVLMLAIEAADPIVIFDDMLARRMARSLGIRLTGALGLLIDAKRAGLIPAVSPLMDRLQSMHFRLSPIRERRSLS
jgi:uncharacterized protein